MQINDGSGATLLAAAHGPENLATLRSLGFGTLLVVPLLVHEALLGAITFVSPAGDAPFTPQEISLASDLADRCAMALDNARLYREADALRAAADAGSRAKSAFLGNMSHELMTPLNAIGGYTELLEMGLRGAVTPDQRTDLSRIKQNQQHLVTLISEILNFVRSESGHMEYHLAQVPLRLAVNDVAAMLEGAATDRNLSLDRSRFDDGSGGVGGSGPRASDPRESGDERAEIHRCSRREASRLASTVAADTVRHSRVATPGRGFR